MNKRGLLAFAVATAALSGTALAADISPVVIPPAPPVVVPVAPTVAGYIDLHFGIDRGTEQFYYDESPDGRDEWRSLLLGGAGRGAYELSPALNVQLDAWYNFIVNTDPIPRSLGNGDNNVGRGGIGAHMFADTASGLKFGALASVGNVTDYGMFANFGGEAAASLGNFTVSVQGGYTIGIASEAAFDGYRNMYARVGGTFYLGQNTSVAANVGFNRTALVNEGVLGRELTWGARVEHKLGSSPFAIFGAYRGYSWQGADPEDYYAWNGTEHAFVVGVRMLFGRDTLQALDAAVPFADYNATYGDPFIR